MVFRFAACRNCSSVSVFRRRHHGMRQPAGATIEFVIHAAPPNSPSRWSAHLSQCRRRACMVPIRTGRAIIRFRRTPDKPYPALPASLPAQAGLPIDRFSLESLAFFDSLAAKFVVATNHYYFTAAGSESGCSLARQLCKESSNCGLLVIKSSCLRVASLFISSRPKYSPRLLVNSARPPNICAVLQARNTYHNFLLNRYSLAARQPS